MTTRALRTAIEQFDFEYFLNAHDVRTETRQSSNTLAASCPVCHHAGRKSFYVNALNGLWYCHVCLAKGGPVQLVMTIMNCDYANAVQQFTDGFTFTVRDEDDIREVYVKEIELPPEFILLSTSRGTTAKPYREYAHSRGITDEMIEKYRIGFCPTGRYHNRLVIPVYHFGKLVSFVARAIHSSMEQKFDGPPLNDQGDYCFNLENIWGVKEVVVMEGVFDVLALPEQSVATFGKKISAAQISLLKKSGATTLIFCYDPDALSQTYKFAGDYDLCFETKVALLPVGEDPSSLGHAKMLEIINDAKPFSMDDELEFIARM